MIARALFVLLLGLLTVETLPAQTRFELRAPELNRSSQALISDDQLSIIDQQGRQTNYERDPRLDSSDGNFLAFRNDAMRQVIRWPINSSGPVQIGTILGNSIEYRPSQMQIVPGNVGLPGGGAAGFNAVLPPGGNTGMVPPGALSTLFSDVVQQARSTPQILRLAVRDERGRSWYLGNASTSRLALYPDILPEQSDWLVVPAGPGMVRLQKLIANQWLAMAVASGNALTLEPVGQHARQLWRVLNSNTLAQGYWLESVLVPGHVLSGSAAGVMQLLPIAASPWQTWSPWSVPMVSGYEPMWKTVSSEVQANPPLAAAQIDLVNSHSSALIVLIGDRRSSQVQQLRIEPGNQVTVAFDRDAGATLVETYEIRGPSGVWDSQQYVTPVPPAALYDLSVYEEFLQSIAIDRTGKSPNPVEDVNYQPKSVGWVPLPAGAGLPDSGQIDVFAEAKAARNPGAVRRINPQNLEKPAKGPDPLRSLLEQTQGTPGKPPSSSKGAGQRQKF